MFREIHAARRARQVVVAVALRVGLSLVLFTALFFCPARAQSSPPSNPQPPAPVPSQAEKKNMAGSSAEFVALLAGKSKVFPNLAVTTKPLTTKQKFQLAANNSVSLFTLFGAAAGAGVSQARNTYAGYGQDESGYFKRLAASLAFASSSNLFGTFALASALHEDPRFFVKHCSNFGQAFKYSTSRVFITRMDDGSESFNWSNVAGRLAAAGLSNAYLPAGSTGVGHTFEHWGQSLAISAAANLLREYWPSINKKLRLPNIGLTPSSSVELFRPAAPTRATTAGRLRTLPARASHAGNSIGRDHPPQAKRNGRERFQAPSAVEGSNNVSVVRTPPSKPSPGCRRSRCQCQRRSPNRSWCYKPAGKPMLEVRESTPIRPEGR